MFMEALEVIWKIPPNSINDGMERFLTTHLKTVYKCADGTDFPVDWREPEHVNLHWAWNDQHFPKPVKLFDAATGLITDDSARRAYGDAEIRAKWVQVYESDTTTKRTTSR